jgi:hypothetical protein
MTRFTLKSEETDLIASRLPPPEPPPTSAISTPERMLPSPERNPCRYFTGDQIDHSTMPTKFEGLPIDLDNVDLEQDEICDVIDAILHDN